MNKQRVSKSLSYMLRHSTDPIYIDLNGGWAWVDEIVQELQKKYKDFHPGILAEIVKEDKKTRYSYDVTGKKIRANQGHSIPGVIIDMEEPEPPEFLYHGTAKRFLPAIMAEGLKPMSRLYVHISPDIETARKVGARHGQPIVLTVKAKKFVQDGHALKRSANGIWQAKEVPPEYIL